MLVIASLTRLAALGAVLCATSPAPTDAQQQVSRIEEAVRDAHTAWFEGLLSENAAALDRLLADDVALIFGGYPMPRAQFLSHLKAGELYYDTAEHEETLVRFLGTTGVVNGRSRLTYRFKGKAGSERLSYTAVYAVADGQPRLLTWHSTMLPER